MTSFGKTVPERPFAPRKLACSGHAPIDDLETGRCVLCGHESSSQELAAQYRRAKADAQHLAWLFAKMQRRARTAPLDRALDRAA